MAHDCVLKGGIKIHYEIRQEFPNSSAGSFAGFCFLWTAFLGDVLQSKIFSWQAQEALTDKSLDKLL